ncbi:MAG TPA: tetratricopeptide repeat protein, partial [Candidatus Wallbacteria bacterium]|nr:tetratricopeptide repeat protein [Candidatus Wallbacteria bacterium]
ISAAKKERIELKNIINEGISEFNDKNYMKAISALEKALVRGNDEPDVLWYLALSYQQVEKLQKSAEYMQKYISVSEKLKEPPHPMHDARSILAYLFIKQNNFDSARSEYLKIISLDPGSRPAQSAHDALKRIEIMKKRSVEEAADGKEDLKKASGDASINIEKDDEE